MTGALHSGLGTLASSSRIGDTAGLRTNCR